MVFRKPLVVAAAASSAALLSACSAGSTGTQWGRLSDDGVVIGAVTGPASLDFTTTGGAAIPQALMNNVYETLVDIDDSGQIVPKLATSWTVSEDETRYVFTLREGVRFSTGEPFTAETAAWSIGNVQHGWTNSLKVQMAPVESARALDRTHLEVTLSQAAPNWLWSMATLTGAMMNPATPDATHPVGTGPYLVDRFVPSESIHFTPNPDYWGEPATSDAAIRYNSDAMSTLNALRTGDLDAIYGMQTTELLDSLAEDFRVEVGTTNGEVLLSMNNAVAPFDDVRVRRAVAYAIDRQAINDAVWEGLAVDTGGAPVPPTDPWFTGRDYAPFSPDRARELLAEAGYDAEHRPHVTITIPSLPYAEKTAVILVSQLRDVGMDVDLETAEFPAVWLNQVMGAKDYQMSLIAHVEARDLPTIFGTTTNYLNYDNAEVRADLEAGRMGEAVDKIMADMGALTIANLPNVVLSSPEVSGIDATAVTDSIRLAAVHKQVQAQTPAQAPAQSETQAPAQSQAQALAQPETQAPAQSEAQTQPAAAKERR